MTEGNQVSIGRRLVLIVITAATLGCAVAGLFYGVTWAENILLFTQWVCTVTVTFAALNKESDAELRAKGPTLPRWLSVSTDMALAAMFAAVGYFGYAAMVVWQIACECGIYDKKEQK